MGWFRLYGMLRGHADAGVVVNPRITERQGEAATGYLKTNPNPTRAELAHGVSGNLCRCQDYDKILTAMMHGAELMRRA